MKNTKKWIVTGLSILALTAGTLGVTACKGSSGAVNSSGGSSSEITQTEDDGILQVYNMYVSNAQANGEIPLSYEMWLLSIRGEKGDQGDKGDKGDKGDQGVQGEKGEDGEDGKDGKDGEDGLTPYIGANGNWWIGTKDTGIAATGAKGDKGDQGDKGAQGAQGIQGEKGEDGEDGEDGLTPYIGANGNWWIGTKDTGIAATGAKGDKGDQGIQGEKGEDGKDGEDGEDGLTPYIGANGNWWIGTTDTGIAATGAKGDKGEDGKDGANGIDGQNGVDGKSAYELYCKAYPNYTGTLEEWLASLKGENGRGILRTEFSGFYFIIYYTDGTSEIHDLSNMFGDPNERAVLVFSKLSDGTYGVMAGGMAKYEALIEIPAKYNGIAVTQILSEGFSGLTSLQEVVLPEGITIIGRKAFYGCSGLSKFDLPNTITTIEQYAFANCYSLTTVVFPESVTRICAYAYYNSGLTSATLADAERWKLADANAVLEGWYYSSYSSYTRMDSVLVPSFYFQITRQSGYSVDTKFTETYDFKLGNPTSAAPLLTKRVEKIGENSMYRDVPYKVICDFYKSDWVKE